MKTQIESKVKTIRNQVNFLHKFIAMWDKVEKGDNYEIDVLSELYEKWLKSNRLAQMSADELICQLHAKEEKLTGMKYGEYSLNQ